MFFREPLRYGNVAMAAAAATLGLFLWAVRRCLLREAREQLAGESTWDVPVLQRGKAAAVRPLGYLERLYVELHQRLMFLGQTQCNVYERSINRKTVIQALHLLMARHQALRCGIHRSKKNALMFHEYTDATRHLHVSEVNEWGECCLLYTSPSPRDQRGSRMPSSA